MTPDHFLKVIVYNVVQIIVMHRDVLEGDWGGLLSTHFF